MSAMRRLLLGLGVVAAPLLALSGCASPGYGSGGGFESYDDCYDGYCVGYDTYGRAYHRSRTEERGDVDRIDRDHGTTRTVSRGPTRADATSRSTASASRMDVSRSAPPPPPPAAVSRRP